MANMTTDQGYGIKCEPDMSLQPDYFHAPSHYGQDQGKEAPITPDMDLSSFLEMDLSELSNGANATEWNSLFNGQLDGMEPMDPTASMQLEASAIHAAPGPSKGGTGNGGNIDRWLMEETHKLERQQKIQQQRLLELQQTLLKTEILKNQLQIVSISHSTQAPPTTAAASPSPPPPSLLGALAASAGAGSSFNFTPTITPSLANSSPPPPPQRLPPLQKTSPPVSCSPAASPRMPLLLCPSSSPSPLGPLDMDDDEEPLQEGDKRKVHNLIEKKYRCSINDRIGMLRDMVSKHTKDGKRLQKSAVLQKTIDYIQHLENAVRRLQAENRSIKETLTKLTGSNGLPSPPPDSSYQPFISPPQSIQEDSDPPSSPDSESSPLMPAAQQFSLSHFLMCVMLVAVFFVNPMTFYGGSRGHGYHAGGGMRSLSGMEEVEAGAPSDGGRLLLTALFWALRLLIAAVCFGWMTFKSLPGIQANPDAGNNYWKFQVQAKKDLERGELMHARDNLEAALTEIGRPTPTTYYGIVTGLVWSIFSHLMFQLVVGRWAVSLASVLIRNPHMRGYGNKLRKCPCVTFADVAKTYHLLHQINMASNGGLNLHGTGFYLALNALNFSEADRPFRNLSDQMLSEMFFLLGLQCHFSLRVPYVPYAAMWYYFCCSRASLPAKSLRWTVTPQGRSFLLSARWVQEVKLGSKLYQGPAALPSYSMTRAFCKDLLRSSFTSLLLPGDTPSGSHDLSFGDASLEMFKSTLAIAKDANAALLSRHGNTKQLETSTDDSGFAAIQWWSSVGVVAHYWSAGKDKLAETYFETIEGFSGDCTLVPVALQFAFKANKPQHRQSSKRSETPTSVMLQLCSSTSDTLKKCMSELMQDECTSTEKELHKLGVLLACDWLLDLRIRLWEGNHKDSSVVKDMCSAFHQDLTTLSQLVTLLPSALPRLRLYRGCYQLIAGANPLQAQSMLSATGRSSLLRRRARGSKSDQGKESSRGPDSPAQYSHEHAMALLLAYKHLPDSLQLPGSSRGDMLPLPSARASSKKKGSSAKRQQSPTQV